MMSIRELFIKRITRRPPDFVIGSGEEGSKPYMSRWWVIPRNKHFNVYLHHFTHSDDDRALHDHPWWNISVLLFGRYLEHTPTEIIARQAPAIAWRPATALHRIELYPATGVDRIGEEEEVWTLFITGPKIRDWGFACPKGWKPWQEFVSMKDKGSIGPGCGDA